MDRINGADTVDIGGGKRGFQDEDLLGPQTGTEVTAEWLNMVQEEICGIIEGAGIELDPGDWGQLAKALKLLGLSNGARARRWMAVISMTTTAPPGAPAEGDAYLIPAGATDAWAAHVGKIAEWSGTAWAYVAPPDGHGISLPDGRVFERVAGTYVEKVAKDVQSGKWTYAEAAGSANALTATLAPAPDALVAGMEVSLKVAAANTSAAATLDVNGLGAVTVYRPFEDAIKPGDIGIGINTFRYDGTYWRLVSPANVISGAPASRWTKLSNGLIMQWGKVSTSTSGPITVTFPIAFPTAVGIVVVSDESSPVSSSQMAVFGVGNITTSNFQCASTNNFSSALTDTGNWLAIGY